MWEEKRKEHNLLADTDSEQCVSKISRGTFIDAMTDKGYTRMRCYTGLCSICSEQGHANFEALIKIHDDMRGFFEKHNLPWPSKLHASKKAWEGELRAIRDYLKVDFRRNLRFRSSCTTHSMHYALASPDPTSDFWMDISDNMSYSCEKCNRRIAFFENINDAMIDAMQQVNNHDSMIVSVHFMKEWKLLSARLVKMSDKCDEYIAHIIRDTNAEKYQQKIKDGLKGHEVSMDFDYMMKHAGSAHAEKKKDHFAKPKTSLLGGEFIRLPTIKEESRTDVKVDRVVNYMNLVSADVDQDWFKATQDVNKCTRKYQKQNPQISDAYVWFDGAGNFASAGMMYNLMVSREQGRLNVKQCNRNEAQEGKKALDTHFSHEKGYLDAYVRAHATHSTLTADGVVKGLNWRGGMEGNYAFRFDSNRSQQPKLKNPTGELAGRSIFLSEEFGIDATTNEPYVLMRENAGVGKGRKVTKSVLEKRLGISQSKEQRAFAATNDAHAETAEAGEGEESMPAKMQVPKHEPKKRAIKARHVPTIDEQKSARGVVPGLLWCPKKNCPRLFTSQKRLDNHLHKYNCEGRPDVVRRASGVAADAQLQRNPGNLSWIDDVELHGANVQAAMQLEGQRPQHAHCHYKQGYARNRGRAPPENWTEEEKRLMAAWYVPGRGKSNKHKRTSPADAARKLVEMGLAAGDPAEDKDAHLRKVADRVKSFFYRYEQKLQQKERQVATEQPLQNAMVDGVLQAEGPVAANEDDDSDGGDEDLPAEEALGTGADGSGGDDSDMDDCENDDPMIDDVGLADSDDGSDEDDDGSDEAGEEMAMGDEEEASGPEEPAEETDDRRRSSRKRTAAIVRSASLRPSKYVRHPS